MQLKCPLILASASPRRKVLLEQLGLSFKIHASDVDEQFNPEEPPETIVQYLADKKCKAISPSYPQSLTLAADTIVVLEGKILGKPTDSEEARNMLSSLSNNQHQVLTGIALSHPESSRHLTTYEKTLVTFDSLSDQEITSYINTGSPFDKAGSYGIQDDQGALYISHIQGDYYNVVGLPLHRLYQSLKTHFQDLLVL